MTPFSGLLFFYVMGLLLSPAVVLGLLEKPLKHYGLLFTVLMIAFVFGENGQFLQLAIFFLWEVTLCFLYLHIHKRSSFTLTLSLALSLMPLVAAKVGEIYRSFDMFQFLGVSYMTFRSVQVIIDIHDGKIKQLGFLDTSYFLLFFPSVASGPIDRYQRFLSDLNRKISREEYIDILRRGVWKLAFGALSGIVIGGFIWNQWLVPLPTEGLRATISYMYGYTFYLFFNFAGYSSMAIGTAYILGITLPENFRIPFLSTDMKDFWSRWHISLSTWLRDYVYIRFVMGSLKANRFKNKRTASYLGYIVNMMIMGAWHGLTPAYLLYGVYHSVLICLNEALDLHWKPFRKLKQNELTQIVLAVVTFHLFSFGLLIFSGRLI